MIKYLIKKKEFLYELLIFITVSIVSIFITSNWVKNGLINPVDHQFPLNFIEATFNKFYTWNDYIYLGFNQSLSLLHTLPYLAFFSIFQSLKFKFTSLNFLEYFFTNFFSIYFTYLYLKLLFKNNFLNLANKFSLILVSSFMLTNLVNVALFSSGFIQQVFAFSFVPLTLYFLRKQLVSNNFKYLFPICISSLFLSVGNYPYTIIFFILVFIVNLSYIDFNFQKKLRSSIIFTLIFILVNLYWILPFLYSLFLSPSLNLLKDFNSIYFSDYLKYVSTRYSLDYLFSFSQNYLLIKSQNSDNSFLLSYLGNYVIRFIAYLTVITVLWSILLSNKTRSKIKFILNNYFLFIIFLIFIFIAKGSNYPFGSLIQHAMTNSTFIKMFRDPLKLILIPSFIFILWMGSILIENKNIFVKSFILLFMFLLIIPFFSNTFFEKFSSYKVPDYYFEFQNYLLSKSDLQTKRILILDSLPEGTNYIFNTGYTSANLAKVISPIPTIELFSNGGGNSYYVLQDVYKRIKGNDSDISIFKKLGVTYVLQQNDIIKSKKYHYSSKYFYKKSFGKLNLYELKKEIVSPQIYSESRQSTKFILKWQKQSPVKYNLQIKNLGEKFTLYFLYSFDQNWKLYYQNNLKLYWLFNLFKKPVFDNTHRLVNQYANGWTIDSNYIKQNFSKKYYKQNPDGTVNIELTLYFKSQSYFYFGLIISSTTLVICLGYLSYVAINKFKNRNK